MRCRHTVPDWHRHVAPENEAAIFAACRLLVKDGQRAADARTVACGYWGRQESCPLYEGPRRAAPVQPAPAPGSPDIPVVVGEVWPVRGPGEPDVFGLVLVALNVFAILALAAAAGLAIGLGSRALPWVFAAVAVSGVTHALTALGVWARR
jgi:hypothetical protein